MLEARRRIAAGSTRAAWPLLERAHVLSQPDPGLHIENHWWMLRCAIAERDVREIIGQGVRLVLAGPGSLLGRYPVGNTGRARVGILQPMKLAPDVKELFDDTAE